MNEDYFDRLEAELRSAVPRASGKHPKRLSVSLRRFLSADVVVAAVSLALTAAVVLAFVVPLGGPHRSHRPSDLQHRRTGPGTNLYPFWAVPTRQQLLDNFAVLRRAQTAQDRTWQPQCGCGDAARQLNNLTRFAVALPSGYKVYLDVEQFLLGGQLDMAAGSYVLNFTVVDPHGPTSSSSFGPNTSYTVFPISSGGNDAVWASVIPDGVARVQWTFACPGARQAGCPGVPTRTFTVPVVDNVAARQVPGADNCGGCASPRRVVWLGADSRVVASFDQTNLAAAPFIKGGRGHRLLRWLHGVGISDERFGQPAAAVVEWLNQAAGPAAYTQVPIRGCGIDHESVWTSPALADPLTIYEHDGRFVGYSYGAPASGQPVLSRGPGAVLLTRAGLTLGTTVGTARRRYGVPFRTSIASGGTWQLAVDNGRLRGSLQPLEYPLRTVTAKNPVATISAGQTGCAGKTP